MSIGRRPLLAPRASGATQALSSARAPGGLRGRGLPGHREGRFNRLRRLRRLGALFAAGAAAGLAAIAIPVTTAQAADANGTINVLYAGSLVNAMERSIGPAFTQATGIGFKGYAAGSGKIANEIKGKLRRGDVFISAAPAVNDSLSGAANGGWVDWYATFAQSPLLIGYSKHSKFAADLKTKRWDQVLQEPGIRIGRTDAKLDPKGALTLQVVDRAAKLYNEPDLAQKILGAPDNPAQVLPEETLLGRLQSGQLDAGFFYATETSDAKIPAVPLPPELKASAIYTITVLNNAANPDGAHRFMQFLLSPEGHKLLVAHGIDPVSVTWSGNRPRPAISSAN